MAVTFVAAGAESSAASGTTVGPLALPAGIANGDLLLLIVAGAGLGAGTADPTGWTKAVVPASGSGQMVWYRYVDGTETAPTPTSRTSSGVSAGVIVAYRGVDKANPFTMTSGLASATSTLVTSPGSYLAKAGRIVGICIETTNGSVSWNDGNATTSGATTRVNGTAGASTLAVAVGDTNAAAAVTSGTNGVQLGATTAGSNTKTVFTIGLNPTSAIVRMGDTGNSAITVAGPLSNVGSFSVGFPEGTFVWATMTRSGSAPVIPTGFTLVDSFQIPSSTVWMATCWRVWTAADAGNNSISGFTGSLSATGFIGVNRTLPVGASARADYAAVTSLPFPSVTPASANTWIVGSYGRDSGSTGTVNTTAFTGRNTTNAPNVLDMAGPATPATATGAIGFTMTASQIGSTITYALNPGAIAPNAPVLTAPANASYQDVSGGIAFQWTFSNSGPGTQNAYALRQKISGAGSYLYWNAGTNAWQSSIVWNALTTGSVTISTGLANGNIYNWSVATQESSNNLQGPFATDSVFTAQVPPAATVSAPSGTITTTATPTVTWTDTLPSGAVQTKYRVVVESGSFGTVPGSGTTVWDSGDVTSAATSVAVPSANHLTNGVTYRFFVRVTETGGQQSSWAYSSATLSLTPPTTPSLVVTAQPASARVKIDVTAGAGGPGATYYLIERSADAGVTWTYVRAASPLTPLTYGATATAYDYEAPSSQALLYRVTSVLATAGNLVYSSPSATAAVTLTLTSAWLKDPLDPTRNVALGCLDNIAPTRSRGSSVLQPLGATYPVVQVDARRSKTFTVTVTPMTQAELDAIDVLLSATARVLLLQRPPASTSWRGVNVYFVVTDDDTATPVGQVKADNVTLDFGVTEVAVPALA